MAENTPVTRTYVCLRITMATLILGVEATSKGLLLVLPVGVISSHRVGME